VGARDYWPGSPAGSSGPNIRHHLAAALICLRFIERWSC
jgi:hypothetical protein